MGLDLYGDPESHYDFHQVRAAFPHLIFFQPSPEKAPWHVQARLETEGGETVMANFYPHKRHVYIDGWGGFYGADAMIKAISMIASDKQPHFDLFED